MAEPNGAAPTKARAPARTIDALVEEYLRERLARHELNRPSAKNHRCTLQRFAAAVADTPVRKLTREDVEAWLETREAVSATTRRGDLSRVRTFCGWLVRRGHLRSDPTIEIPPIRQPRRLPRSQSPGTIARLLAVVPDARGRLICLVMVQEGLRCAEVERLQLGDIDFGGRQVLIRGKGGHERALPISDETWSALDDYLADFPATSGPLVRSYLQPWRPLAADTIGGYVAGWFSDAGIKRWARDGVSAHALRHTCAVDMLRHGATPLAVRDALGHSHLSTTELYMRGYVEDLRKAMGGRKYRGAVEPPPEPSAPGPADVEGRPLDEQLQAPPIDDEIDPERCAGCGVATPVWPAGWLMTNDGRNWCPKCRPTPRPVVVERPRLAVVPDDGAEAGT